jgi:uncharacterized protein with PIN domain
MQVTIRLKPAELLVHTVSVRRVNQMDIYLFRCYKCGTAVAQFKGEIVRIEPGLLPSDDVPVVSQCFRCKEYYSFQTTTVKKDRIELRLANNIDSHFTTFRCVLCRMQLLEYNSKFVKSLPEWKSEVLPYKFDCSGKECNQKYVLKDVI